MAKKQAISHRLMILMSLLMGAAWASGPEVTYGWAQKEDYPDFASLFGQEDGQF